MKHAVICANIPGPSSKHLGPGTFKEFEKAHEDASNLARECGDGYVGYVWANLGWRYRAHSADGRISVYPSFYNGKVEFYYASVHAAGETGMLSALGSPSPCKTPKKAIANCLKTARDSIAKLQTIVEGL